MTVMHFANVWEQIADRQPDAPAVICGEVMRTWREYDERAARFAAFLDSRGHGPGSKVGVYLHNCNQFLEAQFGIMKARGVTINVNYRYREEELAYLLEDADCEAIVYQTCYAGRVAAICKRLPRIRTLVRVEDDSTERIRDDVEYEEQLSRHDPMPRIDRSEEDLYMLYTGGTTGMPKGVMYNAGEMSAGLTSGWVFLGGMEEPPATPEALAEAAAALYGSGEQVISLAACPLMHGTGMWVGSLIPHMMGAAVVTIPKLGLDPELIWNEVERNQASFVVIVGDAFAKPMLAELDRAEEEGRPHDISSVKAIMSSGVMWSSEVKAGLLRHHDMALIDAMGSTEGSMGTSIATREDVVQTARFELGEEVKVFDDWDREIEPGSGKIGMIGTPATALGYYKDPDKSAQTFREIEGVRYSFPGDFATVEEDGTITLLGRGSKCINTAGEKVFPEEVEEALKRDQTVFDCLVVGLPDERFGERVVAVVSLNDGPETDEASLIERTRQHLAGYKLPKQVFFVPEVQRAPSGKADYDWAEETALALSS